MRYLFNQEAHSILNRVYSALNEQTLVEYGNLPVGRVGTIMLWSLVDDTTDWNGETENAWTRIPELQAAWETMLRFDTHQSPEQVDAEDAYHQAEDVIVHLDNLIWLSILVVNASNAIEGSPVNHWATDTWYDKIEKEFKKEYEDRKMRVLDILWDVPIFAEAIRKAGYFKPHPGSGS